MRSSGSALTYAALLLSGVYETTASAAARHAYVANFGSRTISEFTIKTNGVLAPIGSCLQIGTSSPTGLVVHPSGSYLYAANQSANTISMFTIAASGCLTAGPLAGTSAGPTSLGINSSGTCLFVTNEVASNITGYPIGVGGALGTPAPLTVGAHLSGLVVDQSHSLVYAADSAGGLVYGFRFNAATCLPASIAGSPWATGIAPTDLAIDVGYQFLFVTNNGSNTVEAFTINTTSGAIASVGSFATGVGPVGAAVDSFNHYLYVANSSGTVSGFTIANGLPYLTSFGPFPAATSPMGATVDYTGSFLYVADSGANAASAYTITSTTGQLVNIPGTPFATGSRPMVIATTP